MSIDPLARLLDAERAAQPPSALAERGLTRLLEDLGAQVAPLPVATGALKLGLSLVPKWLVVGFAVGLGGAGAVAQLTAPASATTTVSKRAAVTADVSAIKRPAPVPQAAEPLSSAPSPAVAVWRTAEAPQPAPVQPSSGPTFDAELRLITQAKGELERGRPHLARAWLDEHGSRFAAGVFAVEREALRVLVSCAERRRPDAVKAFAARYPGSAMLERLQSACANTAGGKPGAVDFPGSTNGLK